MSPLRMPERRTRPLRSAATAQPRRVVFFKSGKLPTPIPAGRPLPRLFRIRRTPGPRPVARSRCPRQETRIIARWHFLSIWRTKRPRRAPIGRRVHHPFRTVTTIRPQPAASRNFAAIRLKQPRLPRGQLAPHGEVWRLKSKPHYSKRLPAGRSLLDPSYLRPVWD